MDKVLSLLGFAKKARKVISGANAVIRSILYGKSYLVIITEDAGLSIKNKITRLCDENSVPYIIYGSSELLSKATGEINKVIFSVEDENFAKSIMGKN
ncbi:MAG: ribosomal L7Ae/L30e/S12e/Gadd45 family protein [Clostridia bacterium]|nr:ribosomal L7Ae/L30e/S12e/Gadd45 family protein [Clostridia bacterium]